MILSMKAEKGEWCWLNGRVVPLSGAQVSVDDRGLLFGDGVYEVVRLYNGKPFALDAHLHRLERSADGLKIRLPLDRNSLARQILKLVEDSSVADGLVYLQLTRGAHRPRNHVCPPGVSPTLLFYARPFVPDAPRGARILSVPDERWRKCWIKTTSLVANVLARAEANERGCDEAVFIDESGIVAECTASNIFAVIDGKLVTHPVGSRVLRGVTRDIVIDCARLLGIESVERPLYLTEARTAPEVFLASTTRQIQLVESWDGVAIGESARAPITARLTAALDERIRTDCGHHIRGS
jgi:D-alanine transaminase